MYRHVSETWKTILKTRSDKIRDRVIGWRKGRTVVRIDRASRIDKARMLGYKAKQGFVLVRVRVGRGGMKKKRPKSGRRPKHMGVTRIKASISMRKVAEGRALVKYPNLRLMNSYFVFQDGKYSWYEIILVDPSHESIRSDPELDYLRIES